MGQIKITYLVVYNYVNAINFCPTCQASMKQVVGAAMSKLCRNDGRDDLHRHTNKPQQACYRLHTGKWHLGAVVNA